jgi:hypothetical protein
VIKAQKVLAEVKSATPMSTAIIRKRDSLVADMERLLMIWIDDQTSHNVPINQAVIQNEAQNLFSDMKAEKSEAVIGAEIGASHG